MPPSGCDRKSKRYGPVQSPLRGRLRLHRPGQPHPQRWEWLDPGLLQHRQHRDLRAAQTRCLRLHQQAATRQTAPLLKWAQSMGSGCPRPDGSQAPLQGGPSDLSLAQDNRRAGIWPDQSSQRPGSLPIKGPREGERGMALDRRHPQPRQAEQGSTEVASRTGCRCGGADRCTRPRMSPPRSKPLPRCGMAAEVSKAGTSAGGTTILSRDCRCSPSAWRRIGARPVPPADFPVSPPAIASRKPVATALPFSACRISGCCAWEEEEGADLV